MVALITRILIVVQAAIIFGLLTLLIKYWKVDSLALALVVCIALVLALRLLLTANNFRLARRYSSETPVERVIGWRQALRLFKEEFQSTMLSSTWSMAFHAFDKRPASEPRGMPVLLIHGYGCNSGYWHAMSKRLTREHITHYAVDLEPVFGDIDSFVTIIDRAVQTICSETGQREIIIVAHSMGGLAARAYLRDHGCEHVAKLVTLGTPHRGTGLANYGVGINSQQMRWTGGALDGISSDWLKQLEESEAPSVRSRIVSIFTHHDNIISPQTSSCLPGATHVEFHGVGHVALGFNPAVQQRVLEEILNCAGDDKSAAQAANN